MGFLQQIKKAFQTTLELGFEKVSQFGLYQLGLKSGYYRSVTPVNYRLPADASLNWSAGCPDLPFTIFSIRTIQNYIQQTRGEANCLADAEAVLAGQFHRYGGKLAPIDLSNPYPNIHWSKIRDDLPDRDIKDIWEPARFGWVFPLARAYILTGDERYPGVFKKYFNEFFIHNPPNAGPHWASAQEVALRIIAFAFAWQVFQSSPCFDEACKKKLVQSIVDHAERIPPTLIYARSQNNNHLISEAVGLFTAGVFLAGHPKAPKWKQLGSYWFHQALQKQITPDGCYVQHSMNYHRFMLQLSLWFFSISKKSGEDFPSASQGLLAKATEWMIDQIDPISGRVPNLGHNDGSNLYPFSTRDQYDYHPTAQAASRAFLGYACYKPGEWDELSLWLGLDVEVQNEQVIKPDKNPSVLKLGNSQSWATLRAAHFNDRPAHADQLHVDLWYRGCNVAQDAGTYRYTAPHPWQNALASTIVHNTLSIDQHDQMQRAGRFLWLKWAQAQLLSRSDTEITVQHDGYRRYGIIHQRTLKHVDSHHWQVVDSILCSGHFTKKPTGTIHWLLPNLPCELEQDTLIVHHPQFDAHLTILVEYLSFDVHSNPVYQLIRAGEVIAGNYPANPISGWFSPAYGEKVPALSFSMSLKLHSSVKFVSQWRFFDVS